MSELPYALWCLVAIWLEPADLLALALSARRLVRLLTDDRVWHLKLAREYPETIPALFPRQRYREEHGVTLHVRRVCTRRHTLSFYNSRGIHSWREELSTPLQEFLTALFPHTLSVSAHRGWVVYELDLVTHHLRSHYESLEPPYTHAERQMVALSELNVHRLIRMLIKGYQL